MFDNIPFVGDLAAEEGDELKRYLAGEAVPVSDPIQWWQDRRKAYPRLSRMAIDYLTIPGKSPRSPCAVCPPLINRCSDVCRCRARF